MPVTLLNMAAPSGSSGSPGGGPSSSGSSGTGGGGILYAVVARGNVVLAEHSSVSGNSSVVAVGLLAQVPAQDGFRASWAAGQHIFHVLHAGGLTYLCMAEEASGSSWPLLLLFGWLSAHSEEGGHS